MVFVTHGLLIESQNLNETSTTFMKLWTWLKDRGHSNVSFRSIDYGFRFIDFWRSPLRGGTVTFRWMAVERRFLGLRREFQRARRVSEGAADVWRLGK